MRGGSRVGSATHRRTEQGRIDAEALFRAYAGFVAAFLHRLGSPLVEVDDLVQEVFLVVHRQGGYSPGAAHPRTWLGAIALRVASHGRRTRGRRRDDNDDALLEGKASEARDPSETLEIRKSLARVQQALDTLDVEHRAAFVLYEIEGETCDAIAVSFGVPVGTIYSRLHFARRRFVAAYAELTRDDRSTGEARFADGNEPPAAIRDV